MSLLWRWDPEAWTYRQPEARTFLVSSSELLLSWSPPHLSLLWFPSFLMPSFSLPSPCACLQGDPWDGQLQKPRPRLTFQPVLLRVAKGAFKESQSDPLTLHLTRGWPGTAATCFSPLSPDLGPLPSAVQLTMGCFFLKTFKPHPLPTPITLCVSYFPQHVHHLHSQSLLIYFFHCLPLRNKNSNNLSLLFLAIYLPPKPAPGQAQAINTLNTTAGSRFYVPIKPCTRPSWH